MKKRLHLLCAILLLAFVAPGGADPCNIVGTVDRSQRMLNASATYNPGLYEPTETPVPTDTPVPHK